MLSNDRTWRSQAARLIPEAIESGRAQGLQGKKLWRYVCRSFPWGPRKYWPYKIWRHEAAVQIGLVSRHKPQTPRRRDDPAQGLLF